jgi:hypothetical protein
MDIPFLYFYFSAAFIGLTDGCMDPMYILICMAGCGGVRVDCPDWSWPRMTDYEGLHGLRELLHSFIGSFRDLRNSILK